MTFPRILAALAAAFLGLVPVGAGAQTISGGGGSVPLTASCITQSVAQLCFDATNTLAQRNGVNAQAFRVYNTYSSGTADEWGGFDWQTTANILRIGTEKAGTGAARNIFFDVGGVNVASLIGPEFIAGSGGGYSWSSGTSPASGNDTGISRCAVLVVCAGNGAPGSTTGTYKAAAFAPVPTTFSGLATCNSGNDGALAFITDATSNTKGTAAAGSGAIHTLVYCDGSGTPAWKIG